MPLIKIDLAAFRSSLMKAMPTHADTDRIVAGLGAAARQRWISLAQSELRSTSRDYVQGIQEVEVKGNVASITLVGVLPNMIERGWPATDLRRTLLGPNSRAKTAADGSRYNVIPFRHGTPGTGGRNVGNAMPESIYAYAKKLAPTLSRPLAGGREKAMLWGGRLEPRSGMKSDALAILTRKEKPWHAMSIYRGMIRSQKTYARATQSSYSTFRTISSKVSRGEQHWMHPGIEARGFAKRVSDDVQRMMASFVAGAMRGGR